MFGRWSLVLAMFAANLFALPGLADNYAEIGRRISEQHCSRCHVVGDFNPMGGIGSTPSFQLMVNALEDWEARFLTFHQRLPHPPFVRIAGFPAPDPKVNPPTTAPFELELDDIERITAFARTLKED
jgi:mono/diheme cytochrome c family protein